GRAVQFGFAREGKIATLGLHVESGQNSCMGTKLGGIPALRPGLGSGAGRSVGANRISGDTGNGGRGGSARKPAQGVGRSGGSGEGGRQRLPRRRRAAERVFGAAGWWPARDERADLCDRSVLLEVAGVFLAGPRTRSRRWPRSRGTRLAHTRRI